MPKKEKMPSLFEDPPVYLPIDRLMSQQKISKLVRQYARDLLKSTILKESEGTNTIKVLADLKSRGKLPRKDIESVLKSTLILRDADLLVRYYLALYVSTQPSQLNLRPLLHDLGTIEEAHHFLNQYQQLSYEQRVFCLEMLDYCPMNFNLPLDEFSAIALFQDIPLIGHVKSLLQWEESNGYTKDPAMLYENSKVSAILSANVQAIEKVIVSLLPKFIEFQEVKNTNLDEEEIAELLKGNGLERGQFCLELFV